MLRMISYVSTSVIEEEARRSELEKIVDTAERNNSTTGITGVLFSEGDRFFQTIEGEEGALRDLYHSIENDPRHQRLNKLLDEPIAERAFADWSLDTFYIDAPELMNSANLEDLISLYVRNIGSDPAGMVEFVKKMIDEMDTFKILRTPYTP